jgi:hypothetical protein
MNDMKKGMMREMAHDRGDVQNMNTNVQEGMNASKEARKAAKEATDVGKVIAGMTREIKNKGPQHHVGTSASYAAVAVRGVTATGTHNACSVKTPVALVQREIIIHVRDPQTIQNLRAMNPRNLKCHIN